jgi:hypothetical protein
MKSEGTPELISARLAYARAPASKFRDILGIFLDNYEHSVDELLEFIERDDPPRPPRSYATRARKVSVYLHRINNTLLSNTLRHIIWSSPRHYRLMHRKT